MTIASILGFSTDGTLRRVRIDGSAPAGAGVQVSLDVTGRSVEAEAHADDDGLWSVELGDGDAPDALRGVACGARVAVRAELDAGPYVEWGGILDCTDEAGAPDDGVGAASELGAAPVVVIRQPPEAGHRVSVTVEGDGSVRRSDTSWGDAPTDERSEARDRDREAEPRRGSERVSDLAPERGAPRREPRRVREAVPAGEPERATARREARDTERPAPRRSPRRDDDEAFVARRDRDDRDLPHPLSGRHDDGRELRHDDPRPAPRRDPAPASHPRDHDRRYADDARVRDNRRRDALGADDRRDDDRRDDERRYDERRADARDDDRARDDQTSDEDATPWLSGGLLALSVAALLVAVAAQGYPILFAAAAALCLPLSAAFASAHSARGWAVWGGAGLGLGVVAVVVLLPMVSFVELDTYLIAASVVAAGIAIGIGVELVFGGQDDDDADDDRDEDRDAARRRSGRPRQRSAPSSRRR